MFCVIGATYEFQWEFIGYEQYSSEVLALAACLMRWYRQARAIRDVNWIESGGYESMRMHLSDFVLEVEIPLRPLNGDLGVGAYRNAGTLGSRTARPIFSSWIR
jgi:hypothetical protein